MPGALSGFALIGAIVLAGWALGRWGRLPDGAEAVLGRVAYTVLAPCLLFGGVANADLHRLLSGPLLISTLAAAVCMAVFALLFRRRGRGERVIGALAGGYTNANYIGIPVATYVLGDATLVVPIVLVQLLIITPVAFALLETATAGPASWRAALLGPARNPLVVAVALGALVAAAGVRLPAVLAQPITTIGQATVPVVLIAFGLSLSGRRVLAAGPDRLPTAVAVLLKIVGMPAAAFGIAVAAGLSRDAAYPVAILAALPTAQNIFLYAQRAGAGLVIARDAIFLSTMCCVPSMLLITSLAH